MEGRMKDFSNKIGIPLSHLDLVLWYREAGEIFK
jgi:N-glycosylase/DNA lyase